MTKKVQLTAIKFLRVFIFLVYFNSQATANMDIISASENLSPDSGFVHSRVKKGGALDSEVDLTSLSDLLLLKRHNHDHGHNVTMSKKSKMTKKAKFINNGRLGHVPLSSKAGKIHPSRQSISNYKNNHVNKKMAGGQMRLNRFYYFNDQLPATRLSQFNFGKDFMKRHFISKSLLSNSSSSKVNEHEHDDEFKTSHNTKRNVNSHQKSKSRFWEPIFVQTKHGPYHFDLPISIETPKSHVDLKDVLHLATRYKNPLDFNYAPLPITDHARREIAHRLVRKRRGLGSWLKSIFHIKKKTTTTPAPRPPPPPPPPPPVVKSLPPIEEEDYYEYNYPEIEVKKSRGQKNDKDTEKVVNDPSKSVKYITDQHGDTQVDWLLPKSLRKSTIAASLNDPDSPDASVEETTTVTPLKKRPRQRKYGRRRRPYSDDEEMRTEDDEESSNAPKISKSRPQFRRRLHKERDSFRREKVMNKFEEASAEPVEDVAKEDENSRESWNKPEKSLLKLRIRNYGKFQESDEMFKQEGGILWEKGQKVNGEPTVRDLKQVEQHSVEQRPIRLPTRTKRSTLYNRVPIESSKMYGKWSKFTRGKNDRTKLNKFEPVQKASKEELRLLHELFMNIVTGKCPQSFDSHFVDTIESNIFEIIDSSSHPSTVEETSPEISNLIHSLVNCSITAERERDSLEMLIMEDTYGNQFSNTNDIEEGGPLYRSKRKYLTEKEPEMNMVRSEEINAHKKYATPHPDLTRLSNFEFSLVTFVGEECKKQVNPLLLHTASQVILQTIQTNFIPFMRLKEETVKKNLNVLKTCTNLIMRQKEVERKLKRRLQNSFNSLSMMMEPSDKSSNFYFSQDQILDNEKNHVDNSQPDLTFQSNLYDVESIPNSYSILQAFPILHDYQLRRRRK